MQGVAEDLHALIHGGAAPKQDTAGDLLSLIHAPEIKQLGQDWMRKLSPKPSFDTPLSQQDEQAFQAWKAKNAPNDSGADYDLRGAFKAGVQADSKSGHWPDTFKKPNHPTFSDESQYAKYGNPGHWNGETFVPPDAPTDPLMRGLAPSQADIIGKGSREAGEQAYQYGARPVLNALTGLARGPLLGANAVLSGLTGGDPTPFKDMADSDILKALPSLPGREGTLGTRLTDAAANTTALVGTAIASGGVGVPAAIAGLSGAGSTYETLTAQGVSPEKALEHAAVAGGVDAAAASFNIGKLSTPLARKLGEVLATSAAVGAVSGTQQLAQDAIEEHATTNDLSKLLSLGEAGRVAGAAGMGALTGVLFGAAQSVAARRGMTDVGPKQEPVTLFSESPKIPLTIEPSPVPVAEQTGAPTGQVAALANVAPMEEPAFHGSPHAFDKFSTEHIGTGEGAQAFGHGLYFAGSKEIAESYRSKTTASDVIRKASDTYEEGDTPSEAADALMQRTDFSPSVRRLLEALKADDWLGFDYPHQAVRAALKGDITRYDPSPETVEAAKKAGSLYHVELAPKENEYLQWDKPLDKQADHVFEAVQQMGMELPKRGSTARLLSDENVYGQLTGEELYKALTHDLGSQKAASDALAKAGVRGIKYLDANSRKAGEGTSNYVIFNDADVAITEMATPSGASQPQAAPMAAPIGRKLEGTTDNTLPPGVPPVRKQDVLDSYMNVLRAAGSTSPMLQGGVPASALGTFNPLTNVVRGTKWGDLATASHEIGHALERAAFGWTGAQSPWSGANAQQNNIAPGAQGELYRLGKALYGNTVPNGGYLREGFAEFIRTWLTDPDALMVKAPHFTQWFDTQFLPGMAAKHSDTVMPAMLEARDASTRWRLQGSFARQQAQTYQSMSMSERLGRGLQWVRYVASHQAWTRANMAQVAFEKEFERRLGHPLNANERVVELSDAVRGQAASMTKMLVDEHTGLDDGVTKTGDSLKQALAPAQGEYDDWMAYAHAKRALSLYDMREAVIDPATGQPIPGVSQAAPRDPGISLEDAQHIVETIERTKPNVALAFQNYRAWNDRVNDTIASIDPELGTMLKNIDVEQQALNPGWESNYVPLRRRVDDLNEVTPQRRSSGGAARRMEAVVPLKGSGRPVKDILPEIIKQTEGRLSMAYQRAPLLRMLDLAEAHPEWAAPFLRPAGGEVAAQTATALADARKALIQQGDVSDHAHDVLGSAMSMLSKPFVPPGGRDPVLSVYRNGQMQTWELDRGVFKSLASVNATRFSGLAHALLTVPKSVVVTGSTVLRPAFGFVLNPMVDLPTFMLNTKYYANPVTALAQWMKYSAYGLFNGATMGLLHDTVKDPYYDVWKNLGGEYGTSYTYNANRTDISAKRIMESTGRKVVTLGHVRDFIDYGAKLMSSMESAARVAETRGYLKSINWDGQRSLTPEEVQQSRVGGKQVTIDFSQAGDIAGALNKIVPFFNSPIQGSVAFARAAKDHPIRFTLAATSAMGLGLAMWARNRDEEWYQQMPLDERSRYWMTRVNVNGRDEIVRWKKPQEIAAVSTILEELSDAAYHGRPPRMGEAVKDAAGMVAPPIPLISGGLPPLAQVPIEMATNHDFFTGGSIVPDQMKNMDPSEQKTDSTTGVAMALAKTSIGRWTKTSPLMVDHFLRGFFGGLPRDVMDLTGYGASLNGRETGASDLPIYGAAFRRGGLFTPQAQALRDYYRLFDMADGRSKSKENPETPDQKRIRMQLTDSGAAIAAISYVRQTYLKTNKERDAAMQDMVHIAQQAVKDASAGTWNPIPPKLQRFQAETNRKIRDMQSNAATAMQSVGTGNPQ